MVVRLLAKGMVRSTNCGLWHYRLIFGDKVVVKDRWLTPNVWISHL